jgi:GNAT superfamily N-acetyltransferase
MAQQKSQLPKHTKDPLDFFRERGGEVMETEYGWCNFYIYDKSCVLENLFIYPEYRKTQKGTALLSQLELYLIEIKQCKYLNTTIARSFNDVERALISTLKRGFKFHSSNNEVILLQKEL